ncbi:alpha/beta fold hydrolase [Aquimarina addita]|uniref:Alpha/beta fold hydrolase n=1 Tax=Aquimarina addita TaxID=870485 RepID=A0ABP7X7H0_9FLAO
MITKINLLLFFFILGYNQGQAQTLDTLINVGNHQLHFEIIKGNNTPIIFEAGNGNDGSVWKSIINDIYKATGATLITYDRAGLGKSEIDTTNISFKLEIKHLNTALRKLGYTKKYFLVAHSFGGFYASEFALLNEDNITGAVFIDIATPCMTTKEWASHYKNSLTPDVWAMLKKHREGLYYVLQNFPDIADYMSTRYISNDIPLTLIVAENLPDTNTLKTEKDRTNWIRCLKEFGNLPNHTYVVAKNADHIIWEKNPEIVVEEIAKLYLKVNSKTKSSR